VGLNSYLPIADHAIVGNHHTVALIGIDGTIDWYCCPRFDSPSIFGALLDKDNGGYFRIAPRDGDGVTHKQLYFPDTNIVITRFLTPDGVGEVTDFMPIDRPGELTGHHRLIRKVTVVRGQMAFEVEIQPRFDYGREGHELRIEEHGALFDSTSLVIAVSSNKQLERRGHDAHASLNLSAGEEAIYVLEPMEEAVVPPCHSGQVDRLAEETVEYWRGWLHHSRYKGRWREMVNRSALTLKLLTYKPTGAIVAAPTTSLPEQMGGPRNWDYRYTWLRDAAFSLHGLLLLGYREAAGQFLDWITERFGELADTDMDHLRVMYRVDGRSDLQEDELSHWEGYCGSSPVRVGNGASDQLQLDTYGELIDAMYVYSRYGGAIYQDSWDDLRRAVDWLSENWDQPDEGIWETRGGRKNFVFSRLQTWVGLDRAARIATRQALPADLERWIRTRDQVYEQILEHGWNPERKAFVQHYDTDVLDASLLQMPLVKFIAPRDPKWLSTLDAIHSELVTDSLVHRYNPEASPDGLQGNEGTFSMCSFWMVEAMSRAGRLDDARLMFEKMLTYANHVGLYSEQIGPAGEALGNFPQAFTHLALISAAFDLDRALG
jgi:GH15 family glucan-1,4-alpha-glucosidase